MSLSEDRESIRQVFEEIYPKNVRTKDFDNYGKMYSQKALWMPPNAVDRSHIPDILEGFSATVTNQDIDPKFTAEEIEVIGDFGYVIGISEATIQPHDGSASREAKYRALWLMKRENGEWKIDRQIWNNKPL